MAVLGTVFFSVFGSHPDRGDFLSAFKAINALELALAVLSIGLSLLLYRQGPAPAPAAGTADPAKAEATPDRG